MYLILVISIHSSAWCPPKHRVSQPSSAAVLCHPQSLPNSKVYIDKTRPKAKHTHTRLQPTIQTNQGRHTDYKFSSTLIFNSRIAQQNLNHKCNLWVGHTVTQHRRDCCCCRHLREPEDMDVYGVDMDRIIGPELAHQGCINYYQIVHRFQLRHTSQLKGVRWGTRSNSDIVGPIKAK